MDATKLAQISHEFRRYKLHILELWRTRWNMIGVKHLSSGETLLFFGKPLNADHSSGMGCQKFFIKLISYNKLDKKFKKVPERTNGVGTPQISEIKVAT